MKKQEAMCEHRWKVLGINETAYWDTMSQSRYYDIVAAIFCEKCGEIKKKEL